VTAPATSPSTVLLSGVDLRLPSRSGEVHILKSVDFEAHPGEAVGIVGPSGSGKTSLLMVIAGLEPVSAGAITVNGMSLASRSEDELAALRRGGVAIVFQSFHLIPTLTALENVALPLEFKAVAGASARARTCLETVGLGHRLSHYPGQLSGGEQQRVAIARAVASGAKVILADEPTGNLDQATGQAIIDLLFSLKEKDGATLLLVTHDKALAARCDRIVEVRDGRLSSSEISGVTSSRNRSRKGKA
jgi:putative ABC transport system ATP-binding protein